MVGRWSGSSWSWRVGALVGAGRQLLVRRAARKVDSEELAQIERLAGEDVTEFGEELARLGAGAGGRLDADGRLDYQRALAAYEAAQQALAKLRSANDVSTITDTLATGGTRSSACSRGVLVSRRLCVGCRASSTAARPVDHRRRLEPAEARDPQDRGLCTGRGAAARGRGARGPHGCHRQPPVPYWEAGKADLPYSSAISPKAAAPSTSPRRRSRVRFIGSPTAAWPTEWATSAPGCSVRRRKGHRRTPLVRPATASGAATAGCCRARRGPCRWLGRGDGRGQGRAGAARARRPRRRRRWRSALSRPPAISSCSSASSCSTCGAQLGGRPRRAGAGAGRGPPRPSP